MRLQRVQRSVHGAAVAPVDHRPLGHIADAQRQPRHRLTREELRRTLFARQQQPLGAPTRLRLHLAPLPTLQYVGIG